MRLCVPHSNNCLAARLFGLNHSRKRAAVALQYPALHIVLPTPFNNPFPRCGPIEQGDCARLAYALSTPAHLLIEIRAFYWSFQCF